MNLSTLPAHLTYCTNIHPSRGLKDVRESLARHALPLKAALSPDAPFGIGLRLSGKESREMLEGDNLENFKAWLDAHGLYVFTMNGFPHGPFHGQPVKAQVHAPDWREEERVAYTLRLAEILTALLPEGVTGGISTSPLSYKAWVDTEDPATWRLLTENVVRVAEGLVRLHEERGVRIHLDLEPEPDGLLENSTELVAFFRDWLLSEGATLLAQNLDLTEDAAKEKLLAHIQVCFDTCHVAVMYEDPAEVLGRFEELGIRIGKVQLSSALRVPFAEVGGPEAVREALSLFAEPTYLHQVIQRNRDNGFTRFPDLPEALSALENETHAEEWRVHFHVPIFVERYGRFYSTQEAILKTLELQRQAPFTEHLEVETYTWGVLPEDLKQDLTASIRRELEWVQHVL